MASLSARRHERNSAEHDLSRSQSQLERHAQSSVRSGDALARIPARTDSGLHLVLVQRPGIRWLSATCEIIRRSCSVIVLTARRYHAVGKIVVLFPGVSTLS